MSNSHPSPQQPQKKGFWKRVAELGPAWISALVALISVLTGGAAYVVVVHVGTAPTPTVSPSPAVSRGGPTAGHSVVGTPSPESSGPASVTANGALLGSYSIDLASGYTVSLGSTQPPQSAFSSTGNGDLEKVYSRLQPAGDDQLEALPDGATPTYQGCSTDTDFTGIIIPYVGTSFCLTEPSGLIAGGEVTATSSGDFASNSVTIHIFIWHHVA